MGITYKKSEEFRAKILEKVGYAFCTPLCALVLLFFLQDVDFDFKLLVRIVASILLFSVGMRIVWQGYMAMCRLDKNLKEE